MMNTSLKLLDDSLIPKLGQGTWQMGEDPARQETEVKALQYGINQGMTLIDTAEMYGDAETIVGQAIQNIKRDQVYIVSKVYPHNAGREKIFEACDRSLDKLGLEYLDMYLLHWRGSVPLAETVACMEELVAQGKIKRWGVSNFDLRDMKELWQVKDGHKCTVNQVLYHLGSRGIEYDLLPWMNQNKVKTMAYCPIAQGGDLRRELINSDSVTRVAKKHQITPVQVLLAFVLRQENMIVIPKSANTDHIRQNYETLKVVLDQEDLDQLGKEFPAPRHSTHLDIV